MSRALDTPVSLGRGSDNDLPLNDPERLISRHQARLCMGPSGTVDISNLSSNSSLFINGNELSTGPQLHDESVDQLLVSRYVLGLRPATLPAAMPAQPVVSPSRNRPRRRCSHRVNAGSVTVRICCVCCFVYDSATVVRAETRRASRARAAGDADGDAATKPVQMIPDDFDVFSPPSSAPPSTYGQPAALAPGLSPGDVDRGFQRESRGTRGVLRTSGDRK